QSGVIAVIRLNDVSKLEQIISALSSGGIYALEITLTTPNAVKIIAELARSTGKDFLIGAGTVLRPHEAEAVLAAGAQFVVSPVFNKQVVDLTTQADKVSIPGAFSSTEILQAWDSGADIVKIFPATALGPNYFKDIHGPLPGIRLTPTGGVSLENAADFIRAGAF
ncbi:MAG: bifunctional 4-hydroxy-2-oxoglutarate aldolase/2-dehydro-3-deoxy-phosphogluconate aldolase, partial [Calditrichales bacterium]